jgi:hypothetical protein
MPTRSSMERGRSNAVVYARVSSKDQEREGFSIPAQTQLLRGYAASDSKLPSIQPRTITRPPAPDKVKA